MLNFSDDEDLFKDNPFLDLFKKEKEKEKDFDFLFKIEDNFKSLFEEKEIYKPPSISFDTFQPLENSFIFEDFPPLRIERRERRERIERRERNIIFNVDILKRRRKYNNLSNLRKKIKSHFIRFLIEFCNDALKEENLKIQNFLINNKFLLPCMYIIYDSNFNFKEKKIKDILKLDLSRKYRFFGIDGNKKLLEEIELLSPFLSELFEMNSLKLFEFYYNKEKPLNKIKFENKEIYLSPGVKTFFDLLEKNKNSKKEIIEAAKKCFLGEENN